ncbi:hypothetical protein V7O66_03405 [Methanolobus sp. ZRKC3]|uniref:hypothetical protein n=1 Tax=Methanolobus sp. ZRKC3 TaxID=3125786 RepID=UPI00324B15B3
MGWQTLFSRQFLKKPGEHLLVLGITGGGKTQDLIWLLEGILKEAPNETVLWNDSGKSNEILLVAQLAPINIIMPEGMDINIKCENADIKKSWFTDPKEVWFNLEKGRVNVLCVEPFIRSPKNFTPVITAIFSDLIDLAHDYKIPVPLSIFYDEFHLVAPAKGHAFDKKHSSFGSEIQYNIERLRSLKVRFIASTHHWHKIRKGVRSSFNWFMINRGGSFSSEEQPKLSRFNKRYEKMSVEDAIIAFPNKTFTDIMKIPYYGEGSDFGYVRYLGKLTPGEQTSKPASIEANQLSQGIMT